MAILHKLSPLVLCLATVCQAQGAPGNSQAAPPSATPPAQSTKTSASTPEKETQKRNSEKDKKEANPTKAEHKKADEKTKAAEEKKAADEKASKEQPKKPSSEVKCAAFYFQDKNPGPANLSEMQKYCADPSNPQQQEKNIPNVGLGDDFFLWVTRNGGKITGEDGEIASSDLRLFLNEIEIDDSKCHLVAADDTNAIVGVRLERPQSSKAAWNQILANGGLRFRKTRVAIGASKKKPLPSRAMLGLYLMQWKWYFWFFLVIFILLMLLLLTNDRLKQMLRDDGPVKNGPTAAYSLSRVQMAYWFILSITAYALIWGITGDRDTINNDILVLIGISAGTFLGAASIDASKKSQAQAQLPAATAKLVQAQSVAAAVAQQAAVWASPPSAADSTAVATADLANQALTVQKEAVYRLSCQALADHNENFLTDILSDENGISFHRFQIVAWSLVLGVIFVHFVWTTLSLPTFGNTLLGLMGISGGTYLGFKFPEQKTP
jgi:chemotaxis protein histidine kinase CheA